MKRAGVPPLSSEQLRHRRGAAIGALPDDARGALRWLTRGPLATSPLLPLVARRALLRRAGVRLGALVYGLERCWFESPSVSIGTGSYVNAGCWFEGAGRIEIGRDCLLGPEVLVLTSTHALQAHGSVARERTHEDVRIGDGCWLGARVTILPGVHLHDGTVVAAGATVTGDLGPGGVYGGIPARRL